MATEIDPRVATVIIAVNGAIILAVTAAKVVVL